MTERRGWCPRLWVAEEHPLGGLVLLEGARAHYVIRVLRLREGESIRLFWGDGMDYLARLVGVARRSVELQIESQVPARPELPESLHVFQGLLAHAKIDWVVQKTTELGVTDLWLLACDRPGCRGVDAKRLAHWQGVLISACEQSGRAVLPVIHGPMSLEEAYQASGMDVHGFFHPGAAQGLWEGLQAGYQGGLWVGPESGWSDEELAWMRARGWVEMHLGGRVLRAETASILVAGMCASAMEK